VRSLGAIDLPTMQKYLNFHFSVSLDLFGQEASTNAANYYTMGVKGRFLETRIDDDHLLTGATYEIDTAEDGRIVKKTVPALAALNERLRQDYIEDCARGLVRWNKAIERAGIAFEMKLPHRAFNRRIGAFAGLRVSPDGKLLSEAEWTAREGQWLPTDADRAYVTSLMGPAVTQPGKFAHWIAPPARGINGQAGDFEYVRFN
jgi:benzoyl-CoA 2,3-dioxygenase component B